MSFGVSAERYGKIPRTLMKFMWACCSLWQPPVCSNRGIIRNLPGSTNLLLQLGKGFMRTYVRPWTDRTHRVPVAKKGGLRRTGPAA